MKKPLLLGVSALALLAVSATLFAQTTTGTSLITQMKAAVHSFTLLADLNGTVPTPSDYISSPVIGKKTGDMLTAGEWNRVLELVAQGGGTVGSGGFEVNDSTTKTRYSIIWNGISWANNPKHMGGLGGDSTGLTNCGTYFAGTLTPNCKMIETAAHDFCQIVFTGGAVGHSELNYIGAKKYRIITSGFVNFTSGTIVECYDNAGGGTGGGGGGTSGGGITLLTSYPQLDCFELGTTDYTCTGQKATLSATPAPYTLDLATVSGVTVPAGAQLAYICATVRTISSQDAGGAVSIGSGPGNVGATSPSHGGGTDRDHGGDSNCWFTPLVQTTKISYTFNKGPTNPLGAWGQITLAGFAK